MIVFRQCLPCAVVWVDTAHCWVCGQKGSNLKGEPPGNKGQHVRWGTRRRRRKGPAPWLR